VSTQTNNLSAVSCASTSTSTSFCMAAGNYLNGTHEQTLIEKWNGAVWSLVPSPNNNGTGTQDNFLSGVSCTSTSFCMAAGSYYNGTNYQTLIEKWNGTTWNLVGSPDNNGSGGQNNQLFGVSCTSASFCMAAGDDVQFGTIDQTLIETWNGTTWSLVGSPNNNGAGAQPNDLNGVSCVSTSFCMVAGSYSNGTNSQTLIETWNGTTWNLVGSPNNNGTGTQNNVLSGVSCISTSFCTAAGSYFNGTHEQTLIEKWNGTTWSLVGSPNNNGTGTQNNVLNAVSCAGTSLCMAAGGYSSGTHEQTLIEKWNGTSWNVVGSPNNNGTGTLNNFLNAVSCPPKTTFCMAAGNYLSGTTYQTLIAKWNGTNWSLVSSPNSVGVEGNSLNDVACASSSTSFCMAAGYYYNGTNFQTLTEKWNGKSWSLVSSANKNTTQDNVLNAVSCVGTNFCMAAGYYFDGTNYQTLIEQWNGTSWSVLTSPNNNGTGTQNNFLAAVSCVSTGFCMAAGYYYDGTNFQTLAEQWNGTGWSLVTSLNNNGTGSQENVFNGVSCVSTSFCMASGFYFNGTKTQSLIEQWNGTAWSLVTAADNNGTGTQNNLLQGVSCTSTSFCMADGYYYNGTNYQTLIEKWNNGTGWSLVTSPDNNGVGTQYNQLNWVSCTSTSFCMAAGYYVKGTTNQTLIEKWNGAAWSLVTSPNHGTGAQGNILNGVSCTSTSFCMAAGAYALNPSVSQTLIEKW
jgi:hypothetical protein